VKVMGVGGRLPTFICIILVTSYGKFHEDHHIKTHFEQFLNIYCEFWQKKIFKHGCQINNDEWVSFIADDISIFCDGFHS